MKYGSIMQGFLVMLIFLIVPEIALSESSEQDFEGVWIRKGDIKEFNPFSPDFAIVEKLGRNYIVIFVNSSTGEDGDRVIDESYHHFYRLESSQLVRREPSAISTITITSEGELFELIEFPDVSVTGENLYVRPTMKDFKPLIEAKGYELDQPIY